MKVEIPSRFIPAFLAWLSTQRFKLRALPTHGNGGIVKFPHKRRQFGVSAPPEPFNDFER